MIYNCDGYWDDDKGRRHKFSIQSDRADRSFIKQLVEAQYPAKRVTVNNVKQKW